MRAAGRVADRSGRKQCQRTSRADDGPGLRSLPGRPGFAMNRRRAGQALCVQVGVAAGPMATGRAHPERCVGVSDPRAAVRGTTRSSSRWGEGTGVDPRGVSERLSSAVRTHTSLVAPRGVQRSRNVSRGGVRCTLLVCDRSRSAFVSRIVIVTGSSRGIGAAVARLAARDGTRAESP